MRMPGTTPPRSRPRTGATVPPGPAAVFVLAGLALGAAPAVSVADVPAAGHGASRHPTAVRAPITTVAPDTAARPAPDPYPLDGYARTGIRRLEAYRRVLAGEMPGRLAIPPGGRLGTEEIVLRLADAAPGFDLGPETPIDPELQRVLERVLGSLHPSYRAALLDITDPARPRYAAIRPDEGYLPGSVGKILVMTGLFEQLRRLHPDDVEARVRLLRETRIEADDFAFPNHHAVPVVADDWSGVRHRAIRRGDVFTLWEWVDHMASPSSNAAASMVWKQILLMDAFGPDYPPTPEREAAFLAETPRSELSDRAIRLVEEPLLAAGIDTADLRIRTFFTNGAQRRIPGRGSHSTPRQLVRWLVRMEQGRLVDEWSSLEMKRLLYFTRRRYRFAYSPALSEAAVYFKSGSLYRCVPEAGYSCGQYRGNAQNLMHSVAIVESPARNPERVYLVSLMSDVRKVNSASEHAEIATRLERAMRELHP
ncbi:MAG: hypothetical protein RRA92_05820 [Gemmatimonadota bacterium]|nr:hypothetical protein [Gemmatimonadota bacterium]